MQLSERVRNKIELAIQHLDAHGVLITEREALDYEFWPQPMAAPDGNGMITTYMVALFAPCGPADHVTQPGVLFDPYGYQTTVDKLIWDLVQKIRKEIDAFNDVAQRADQGPAGPEPTGPGGLYIGKG